MIRTVPSQMFYTQKWMKRMERWLSARALQPMINILHHHKASYREIQQFIEPPPDELHIIEICPPHVLASVALGSRVASLNQDYHLGQRCGRYFLATLGQWLSVAEPFVRYSTVTPPAPVANAPHNWPIMTLPVAGNEAD